MKQSPAFRIATMKVSHIKACENIIAVSDPWNRLHETIDFRSALSADKTFVRAYVCLAGAEPAGFILFNPEPVFARGGYLRAIAVAPAFRKQGVGKKMLAFAERMTSERALHMFLCVSSFNRRAQAFYKKCGYLKA
jgi:ribosomal-protein-alanine N-acetyltransferase